MPDRLQEIRERARDATLGPWTSSHRDPGPVEPHTWKIRRGAEDVAEIRVDYLTAGWHWPVAQARVDAEFIAHSRADVEWLLAEVDRLRKEADRG